MPDFRLETRPTTSAPRSAATASTVHVDGAGIGRRAANLILARSHGETIDERIVDVGFRIVERKSTAA
jgi:DNA-binding LacI/PurR family transcriptional regulator